MLEIRRQPINDLCAPTLLLLIGKNLASNFPIVQDQLGVRRQRRL